MRPSFWTFCRTTSALTSIGRFRLAEALRTQWLWNQYTQYWKLKPHMRPSIGTSWTDIASTFRIAPRPSFLSAARYLIGFRNRLSRLDAQSAWSDFHIWLMLNPAPWFYLSGSRSFGAAA